MYGGATCKPNSVCLTNQTLTVILLGCTLLHNSSATYPRVVTRRAGAYRPMPVPLLFGLAPCGVYPAHAVTSAAVRSYRTFSPLPASEDAGGIFSVALAVTQVYPASPDVIRHTALRSSDFPPPDAQAHPAATVQSPARY
jgi:hypothetical protein